MVIAYLPKTKAGGLNRLPLLLFGLGIVQMVDLQGLLLYNIRRYSKSGATAKNGQLLARTQDR